MASAAGRSTSGGAAAAAALSIHTESLSNIITGRSEKYELPIELTHHDIREIEQESGLAIALPPTGSTIPTIASLEGSTAGKFSIGRGASGLFTIARRLFPSAPPRWVGLKICNDPVQAWNEYQLGTQLSEIPGILTASDCISPCEGKATALICPLAGFGDLHTLRGNLRQISEPARSQIVSTIMHDLLSSLSQMHERGYYHLDLKPANTVINHRGEACLIDFDRSTHSASGSIDLHKGGHNIADHNFFAPERWLAEAGAVEACQGAKIDSWSAGVLLAELCLDSEEHLLPYEMLQQIQEGPYEQWPEEVQSAVGTATRDKGAAIAAFVESRLAILPETPLKKEVRRMLTFDPNERPSPAELLAKQTFKPHDSAREWLKEFIAHSRATSPFSSSPLRLPLAPSIHIENEEAEAVALRSLLNPDQHQTLLHGASGNGKSHLATWLIHHREIQDHFERVLWFDGCHQRDVLESQLLTLGQELGVTHPAGLPEREIRRLQQHLSEKRWLLVLDGANNIDECLSLLGNLAKPHLLITTTTASGGISLDSWNRTLSMELIRAHGLETAADHESYSTLCDLLEDRPVALAQACRRLSKGPSTIADLLETLQSEGKEGAERASAIEKLFSTDIEQVRQGGALGLLEELSLLDSTSIPTWLIESLSGEEEVRCLFDYGMVRPARPGFYKIHPIAISALQKGWEEEKFGRLFDQVAAAMHKIYQDETQSLAGVNQNREMLRHGDALLQRRIGSRESIASTLRWTLDGLGNFGPLNRCPALIDQLAQILRVASNTPLKSQCYLTMVLICAKLEGPYRERIGEYVMAAQQAPLGTFDQGLLLLRLGGGRIDQLELARTLFAQSGRQAAPYEAVARMNLGQLLLQSGDGALEKEGIQHLQSADQFFGENHPHKATIQNNLGMYFKEKAAFHQALDCLRQALSIRKEVLGDLHTNTAVSLENLGATLDDCEQYDEAIGFYQKSREIYSTIYEEEHPRIANLLRNLGLSYRKSGKLDQAIECHRQALAIEEKVGTDVKMRALSHFQIGCDYLLSLSQRHLALEHLRRAVELVREEPDQDPYKRAFVEKLAEVESDRS